VPAVTHETIKPHVHEEATQAVDREVIQHHHHTTVQPLTAQEVLPEKHTHNILPAEHREFHHDDESRTKERLAAEMANFKNQTIQHETRHTQSAAPTVTGEHVHHHVHETVVPVVHKEVIQPEVIHTTVPIHETHVAAAQHHGLSALPMKTLDEFKAAGGALTGGNHSAREEYEGAPRPYNDKLSTTFEKLEEKFHSGHHSTTGGLTGGGRDRDHDGIPDRLEGGRSGGMGGIGGGNRDRDHDGIPDRLEGGRSGGMGGIGGGNRDRDHDGIPDRLEGGRSGGMGGIGGGKDRDHDGIPDRLEGGHDSHLGQRGAGPMGTTSKPSMMDKLNPNVDSNGDGKAGFMK